MKDQLELAIENLEYIDYSDIEAVMENVKVTLGLLTEYKEIQDRKED